MVPCVYARGRPSRLASWRFVSTRSYRYARRLGLCGQAARQDATSVSIHTSGRLRAQGGVAVRRIALLLFILPLFASADTLLRCESDGFRHECRFYGPADVSI